MLAFRLSEKYFVYKNPANAFFCFLSVLQIFFLQGRFIFGPDVRSLGLTIFLIVAPISVFCVFVARKLMNDFSHHLGISIMVVAVVFSVFVSHSLYISFTKSYLSSSFFPAL